MAKRPFVFFILFFLFVLFNSTRGGLITAASHAGSSSSGVFIPLILKPLDTDLTISGLEITQGIQRANNTVPLVSDRTTVVRVFAQTVMGSPPGNITVSLSATRSNTSLGSITVGPQTVPLAPSRDNYNSTFNATLPTDWLSGNVQMVVTVDAAGVLAELDESNNSLSTMLVFHDVPALDVKILPVTYTHTPNGHTYPGQFEDNISDWIERAYPISDMNISYRSPSYPFTGNLSQGDDWINLLYQIRDLWLVEATPGQVYYASIPIQNGPDQWFFSGIAGIGYVGGIRASVGLNLGDDDATGILAGHEIGHNLGRKHAPCGGAANPDPNYPYVDAWIGEYGLDIPLAALRQPFAYKDVMSYCGPEWVSDYTYMGLYNDQVANGIINPSISTDSLMVRVNFDEAGTAAIQPLYLFHTIPTAVSATPDYTIELLDETGQLLVSYPTTLVKAEELDVVVYSVAAKIPMPDKPVATVRLIQAGQVVATRPFEPIQIIKPSLSVVETAESVTLSWGVPEVPALVRYSADGGQTWTVLGLDVLGGRLTVENSHLQLENGRFELLLADSAVRLYVSLP